MDSGTLSDPTVDAFVRERFVAVRVEREHQRAAFDSLKIGAMPVTLLLRADRSEVARFTGYLAPQEFMDKVKGAAGQK